jgi:hypothetical protein
VGASAGALIPGVTDTGTHADDNFQPVALPFGLDFYGHVYSTADISSNGSLTFAHSNASNTHQCMGNALQQDAIEAYQMDLVTNVPASGVFSAVMGTAPHRQFVLEWRAAYYADVTKKADFEIVLHEDTPTISVIYGATADAGAGAVAGIQHDMVAPFTQFECSSGGLSAGEQLDYHPSQPVLGGVPRSGSTLGFTPATFTGRLPLTLAQQWQRCDAQGANCVAIPSATGPSYVAQTADLGHTLRVDETAANADGSGAISSQPSVVITAPPSPPPAVKPVLSRLSIRPSHFVAAKKGGSVGRAGGGKVSYRLSLAASIRFSVIRLLPGRRTHAGCRRPARSNRHKPRCTIRTAVGAFAVSAGAGLRSTRFTGRIAGHRLAPGSYLMSATPTAGGLAGRTVSTPFAVIR